MYASGTCPARRANGTVRTLALIVLLTLMCLSPLAPARSTAAQESPYAWIQQEMIEIRGLPLLHPVKERYITREEFRAELADTEIARIKAGKDVFFGRYAATDQAEFFAVSMELFFERAEDFRSKAPELHRCMAALLRQTEVYEN